MGILIQDGGKKDGEEIQQDSSLRKRKQGKTVRNPMDMFSSIQESSSSNQGRTLSTGSAMENKYSSKSQENVRGGDNSTSRNTMKRNGSSSSLLPLKRAGK